MNATGQKNLTAEEVGRRFGVTAGTVIGYVGREIIPRKFVCVESRRLTFKPDVLAFLEAKFKERLRGRRGT